MRNSVVRNASALLVLQISNLVLPLLTLPYLLRVLGPEQFGVFIFCQAIVAYGVVVVEYGFNLSATRRIAQVQGRAEEINRIFWSVQAAKTLLAVGAFGSLAMCACVVPLLKDVWPVLLATAPVILGAVLFPQWLFQGLERMGFVTLCMFSARALAVPAFFYFVVDPTDTWRAALVQSSGPVAAGFFACTTIRKKRIVTWVPVRWTDIADSLKDGWNIFLSTASISLYTSTTPVLLGFLGNHTVVGLFGAADKLRLAAQSLINPLSVAVYPRVSAVVNADRHQGLRLIRKLLLLQGVLTFALSCGIWLFAPVAVSLLMGSEFTEAVDVLRILAPLPFLIGLSNVFGIQTMIPLGFNKPFGRIVMVSGMFNIALMFLFVPMWKAEGAALSVLITEALVTTSMVIVLRSNGIALLSRQRPTIA